MRARTRKGVHVWTWPELMEKSKPIEDIDEWTTPPNGNGSKPKPVDIPDVGDLNTERAEEILHNIRTWVVAQIAINRDYPGGYVKDFDVSGLEWIVHGNIVQVGGNQFAKIAMYELVHPALNTVAKIKLLAHTKMHQHTDNAWCTTSIATKMRETGVPERTVYRALNEMVRDKVLHKRTTKAVLLHNTWITKPHWYRANSAAFWLDPPATNGKDPLS